MINNAMRSGAAFWRQVVVFLEAIKFEHSVFALPFAILAAFMSADGWPDMTGLFWVIIAMVSMRAFGMSANRLIDGEIDSKNPRTAMRAIPTGDIRRLAMYGYM